MKSRLPKDGNFNLDNIIFNPVNNILVDALFIGKFMKCQAMFFGVIKDLLIPFWHPAPVSSVEGPQIFSAGCDMHPGFTGEEGHFNKEPGVIVKIAALQAGNGNHGAVGSIMEAAQMVFFRFGCDQLHFLLKGDVFADLHCDQTARFPFYDADLGQIHGQQGIHILTVGTQGGSDRLQVGHLAVKICYFFIQKAF